MCLFLKANDKILEFDKSTDDQYTNKIAFIFQRSNERNESEILSNNKMSIEMEDFLDLISTRIQLEGFNKYRADLDTKSNQHGSYSYFTIFENHQIMFNVAPIIPQEKNDEQFIQRKSLIANSLICIVFQEQGALFKPDFILSKVTQVYITVEPTMIDNELYYKVSLFTNLIKKKEINRLF
jgi:signal-induced proliferation-associated 1 like protein 1